MGQRALTPDEIRFLQEALNAESKSCNIRLREGEYQYSLAKAIASFQLELYFPDVKDIIKRLYGEEETNSVQFVRKIQTILKKMEKSNIVKILPKAKPWDLQRYFLSSFKFQDVDKESVVFATDDQIKQAQDMARSMLMQQESLPKRFHAITTRRLAFILGVGTSYGVSIWTLTQPIINSAIFIASFSASIICSLALGSVLSRD